MVGSYLRAVTLAGTMAVDVGTDHAASADAGNHGPGRRWSARDEPAAAETVTRRTACFDRLAPLADHRSVVAELGGQATIRDGHTLALLVLVLA